MFVCVGMWTSLSYIEDAMKRVIKPNLNSLGDSMVVVPVPVVGLRDRGSV